MGSTLGGSTVKLIGGGSESGKGDSDSSCISVGDGSVVAVCSVFAGGSAVAGGSVVVGSEVSIRVGASVSLTCGANVSIISSCLLWNGVNFLKYCRFLRVNLPEPSTFTTYWWNWRTSTTVPVRSQRFGWLPVRF